MEPWKDLSPADIRHKDFKISIVGGYDKHEVDEYLALLADQFERVYTAFNEPKPTPENAQTLSPETLEKMQKREELIANTLLYAQNMRDEVLRIAQDQAKNIVEAAEITAKKTYEETNAYLNSLRQDFINIKESHRLFLMQSHAQFKAMLERLEQDPIFKKDSESKINQAFEDAKTITPGRKN